MDHSYVEEHDLLEAYLAERLSEEERDAFEAHYFSCEVCLERLETADGFREGMRQVAAESLAAETVAMESRAAEDLAPAAAAPASLAAPLRRPRRPHRSRRLLRTRPSLRSWFALAALLLLAALPAGLLWERNRRLEGRLAESAAGAERQRTELEARLHSLEQAGADDRRRLTEELARERQARAVPAQPTRPAQPEVNVPLFLLAAVRSGETAGREPVNQIPLSPGTGSVILAAELATVDHPAYRAILRTADGRDLWQAGSLRPDSRDTLVLLLPASMLQPGSYRLTIEGEAGGGRKDFPVADYPFLVVRNR